jgi:XTP/dITP diphosphohydrolase
MRKLLIGTTNQAKFNDYKNLLKEYDFEFVSPEDLNIPEPREVGSNYEQVAVAKAKYYFEKSKLPTIVDDGGFEVDALNNEPGIKSHRWLGENSSDEKLISEVLKRMEKIEDDKRQCRFVVEVALSTNLGVYTSNAEISGIVAKAPAETRIQGYPYRSLMYLPNYGKFYCDISEQEHDILNHRKHALEKLHDVLLEISG